MNKQLWTIFFGACASLCIMESAHATGNNPEKEKARQELIKKDERFNKKYEKTIDRMNKVSESKDFMEDVDKVRVSTNDKIFDLYEKYDPGLKAIELRYNEEFNEEPVDMLSRVHMVNAGYDDMYSREGKIRENKKSSKEWKEILKSKEKSIRDLYEKYDQGLGNLVDKYNKASEKLAKRWQEFRKK